LQRAFPQVEKIARFHRLFPYQLLSYSNPQSQVRRFEEKGGFFANADVVDIFDVPFVSGNPAQALKDANSIVITEKMAEKYFGKSEPMGKIIQDDRARLALKVTGVVKEFDFPSHLHFDYLVSMPTIERYLDQRSMENIGWSGFYNYILLKDADSKSKVEAGLSAFTTQFYAPSGESAKEILAGRELHLQPVKDIHLHSKLEKEMSPNSDITYIYIFAIAALFILLVAAVNFINISTALAFNRMKEIGLRKVVGATKPQLVRQFLAESLMVTLLATGLAILLFKVSIPFYAQLTSGAIAFSDMFTPANLGIIAIMIVAIAGFAGMYPAWFVARFNPVTSLKGKKLSGQGVNLIRKGLIVFQFSVSVFMIFSTVIIYRQMQLFHNQDLGFNKDQVIAVTMYDQMWEKYGVLVNEMSKKPQISNFSVISTLPGERFGNYSAAPLHQIEKGATPENARMLWSDEKTLATLGVAIKDGRGFTSQFPEIKNPEFILNESAVKAYHLQNPVGEAFGGR
jgi:putative ABC transport system permease protein